MPDKPKLPDQFNFEDDGSLLAHKFAALSLLNDDEAFIDVVDVDDIFDDDL